MSPKPPDLHAQNGVTGNTPLPETSKSFVSSRVPNATDTVPNSSNEDEILIADITARATKGWPILLFELPEARKQSTTFIREIVSAAATSNKASYDSFFEKLGLPAESSERIQLHIKNIHQASVEYEVAQQQVLFAKHQFEKDLINSLSFEQFQEYADFEKTKRAGLELVQINSDFSKKFGENMDSESYQKLQQLLRQHPAYTEEIEHGPFDSLPRVAVGKEQIVSVLTERLNRQNQNASRLLDALAQTRTDPQIQDFLHQYYAEKSENLMREIDFIRNKPESVPGPVPFPPPPPR